MAAIDLRQVDATCSRHMVTDSNEVKDFLETNWARLSPTFRRAHNQLREARGLPPLAEPAVDLWVPPPPSEVRKLDPAGPEFNVAAREFLGSSVPAGNSESARGYTDSNEADDAEFLLWAKANAGPNDHALMAQALESACERCRQWQEVRWSAPATERVGTEVLETAIAKCVATYLVTRIPETRRTEKEAVYWATEAFGVSARAVRYAVRKRSETFHQTLFRLIRLQSSLLDTG